MSAFFYTKNDSAAPLVIVVLHINLSISKDICISRFISLSRDFGSNLTLSDFSYRIYEIYYSYLYHIGLLAINKINLRHRYIRVYEAPWPRCSIARPNGAYEEKIGRTQL